jgi:hypothetical protein
MGCVQVAGAFARFGASESGSKLRALQTLRDMRTDSRTGEAFGLPKKATDFGFRDRNPGERYSTRLGDCSGLLASVFFMPADNRGRS